MTSMTDQSDGAFGSTGAGFTAGPWRVAYDDRNGQAVVSSEHTEIATCWHHSVGSIEKQMRHNAHLIAAAPDLLAALSNFVAEADAGHVTIETDRAARAAIALATGAAA